MNRLINAGCLRELAPGEARFDAALAELRAWSRLPDAALWYAIDYADGVRAAAP